MAITLPLMICLYEWVYNKKSFHASLFNLYNIGYIIISAFYLGNYPLGWGIMDRLITVPYLILNYLKLTIFPVSLSADYFIVPIKSLFSPLFLLPTIALSIFLSAALLMKKELKGVSFGILFFLVTLIPVYNIIPITNPLAERYIYLPAAGFCMVTYNALGSRLKTFNLYFFIPFLAMLSIYSISVVHRNKAWKDDYTLWADAARKVPQNSRPYYNDLGNILYKQGKLEEAVKQYQIAIKLRPDFIEAYNNLGNVLLEMGRVEESATQYRTALKLRPDITDIRINLANLYLSMGQLDEATIELKTASELRPEDPAIHNDLAAVYARRNKHKEAVREYQEVLRLNPESIKTHYDLGMLYVKMGSKDEAGKEFETILQRRPDFLPARKALEAIYK